MSDENKNKWCANCQQWTTHCTPDCPYDLRKPESSLSALTSQGFREPVFPQTITEAAKRFQKDSANAKTPDATEPKEATGQEWLAEDIAREFHETYERLAPSFGYQTRKASAVAWRDVPQKNKDLMIAVAGVIAAKHNDTLQDARTASVAVEQCPPAQPQ